MPMRVFLPLEGSSPANPCGEAYTVERPNVAPQLCRLGADWVQTGRSQCERAVPRSSHHDSMTA